MSNPNVKVLVVRNKATGKVWALNPGTAAYKRALRALDRGEYERATIAAAPKDGGMAPELEAGADVQRPAVRASREEWESYAAAQGADAEEVAGLTKQELIDAYGG